MPVVALFFPVAVAVALTAFVHLLNNLFKLSVLWREIDWPVALKFGVPALLATIPGTWILTALSELPEMFEYMIYGAQAVVTPVKLTVGVLLIIFALAEWIGFAKRAGISGKYLPFGGILSGFFGGLSGHQGAFRSAFLLHAGVDARSFIATNAVIACFVDVTRLVIYGLNVTLLMQEVDVFLIIAASAAAFAGVLAGKLGVKKVTIDMIQKLVAVMLLAFGALLVAGVI